MVPSASPHATGGRNGQGVKPPYGHPEGGMKATSSSRQGHAMRMLWLLEAVVLSAAFAAAVSLRYFDDPAAREHFVATAPLRAIAVPLFLTGAMMAFGLYQVHGRLNRTDFLLRLTLSFSFGGVALLVFFYLVPDAHIGRGVLGLTLAIGLAGVLLVRSAAVPLFGAETFKRRVLVLGAGRNANLINLRMRRRSDRQAFRIVGYKPIDGQAVEVEPRQLVHGGGRLLAACRELGAHELVVAPDERRGALPMEEMLECAGQGVIVTDLADFFEREAGMIKLGVADPSSLVFSGGFDHSVPRQLSKRCFDLAAASLLLAAAAPAMVLVAICVWLESGGPVLYRQTRVGMGGRSFDLVKFRSMRVDAEKDGVARWASKDDDRTTRVGRFIRQTRLDELPQLVNVLRGDMSFVGPRPERPQFVEQLNTEIRYYSMRHSIKPGLTGWAQLRYPYGASVKDAEEKLKFDLFYAKNHGLVFDLMILLQTVEVVVFRRGAR